MTEPNEPTTAQPRNWWQRRGKAAKSAIVIASLLIVVAVFADDPATETDKDTSSKARAAEKDNNPVVDAPKDEPAKTAAPAKPVDPMARLTKDVKKNAIDQVTSKRVKSASCAKDTGAVLCTVEYRLGSMWDGDDEEVARDIGGMLHELFRDTDVQYLHVIALTDTTNELGKETKDNDVAWVMIRRSGWEQVDWDNLQYQDPVAGLRTVSEVYADTLSN